MEVFRLIYGVHFALGIFVAMRLWMFIPSVFAVFDLHPGAPSALTRFFENGLLSFLATLWYFVWYASYHFALRGVFPVVSNRTYAVLTVIVYGATLIRFTLFPTIVSSSPILLLQFFACIGMLAVAAITAFVLPSVQATWFAYNAEVRRIHDERLDQMYRCNDPRIDDRKTKLD